jgi:hypothetical protein
MASGILGKIEPAATTYKTLYKPSTNKLAAVTISIQNRSASTRSVRVALAQAAGSDPTPADGEHILYNRTLAAAGDVDGLDNIQITGHVVGKAGEDQVVVYASGIDVDFLCSGIEEDAS